MFDANWYNMHRMPSIWGPDAEDFKPDRWNTCKPTAWQYAAFGVGPRSCLGKTKALTEASYVTVRLMQEFQSVESRDSQEWTGKIQLTAKNVNGCKVAFTPA